VEGSAKVDVRVVVFFLDVSRETIRTMAVVKRILEFKLSIKAGSAE